MRPIDKGACPQINGMDKSVNAYAEWRQDLIHRIGSYCAYCNMPLSHSMQVEHVVPKQPQPGQPVGSLLAWENMLLACGPCNNAKSNKPSDKTLHYLPESHNGLLPFVAVSHSQGDALIMAARPNLSAAQSAKAVRTIQDFKLDNIDRRGAIVDVRWMKRREAKAFADIMRSLFDSARLSPTYDPLLAGEAIARAAASSGFFLVWFEVFADEPAVLRHLTDPARSPGIDPTCFDPVSCQPIPRNPGDASDPF